MAKYNIGIINYRNANNNYIASCGCGTVRLLGRGISDAPVTCESCGNTNFIRCSLKSRVLHPYLDVLDKSAKGFKVKRTNLSVMVDGEYNIKLKPNMVKVLEYNLAESKVRLWKDGKEINLTSQYKRIYENSEYMRFFVNIDDEKLISMVSVAQTESLYKMAWDELSRAKTWYGEKRIYRGLIKVFDYVYLQILSNAGYPNVQRFKIGTGYYARNSGINTDGKSPKEIFGLPKFCLRYIREDEDIKSYEIRHMQEALTKVDGNRFKELLEIVKDEASVRELCGTLDTLIEIHDTYKYNNLKKLTLYLFREIRMTQGIMSASTGATLLRDYIKMATRLGQEYEKYPKSLKKEHDITQMNYKVKENELKQREFVEKVTSEEYKSLEYKKGDFRIISPTQMQDLINEGNELSHCIASYIDRVIGNRCQIYFMRNKEEIEKPLISIEVANGNIRQARGYTNRKVSQAEKEFIKEWAKKKELVEAYYY